MLVSFVIPIYNTEKYLCKCVDSILSQTYKNIEVLLVDDGSTDTCPDICNSYVKRDERVVVFHKQNGGLSDARNYGLERAKGKYIVFVDSDDYWSNSYYLAELVEEISNSPECDFIGFNIAYFFEKTNTYRKWIPYDQNVSGNQSKDDKIRWMINSGTMPMSACSKILRRDFLVNERIRFIKGIYSEDIPWFMYVLDKCQNFKLLNKYVYIYRQGVAGSITSTFNLKKYNDLFGIVKNGIDFIKKSSFELLTKDALYSFMAYEYLILLAGLHHVATDVLLKKEVKSYQWILEYTANPKVRMAAKIYHIAGLKTTELFMSIYLKIRNMKR